MKKTINKTYFTLSLMFMLFNIVSAQSISTFESLSLSTNSYWNGSSTPLGTSFNNGNAIFPNYYDTSYGGFWSSGWAYSNMTDSTSSGFDNIYSARPGKGFGTSANYVLGQQDAMLKLTGASLGKIVNGFYITNSTYTAKSLLNGDFFGKKFGGSSGNDQDYYKIKIQKYFGGVKSNDSVVFYLSDYRSSDNSKDYIIKNWQWVDLSALGNVDSLVFHLSSSDNGQFGMNTPPFFCMDNLTLADYSTSIPAVTDNLSILLYPNPANDIIHVDFKPSVSASIQLEISDINGKLLYSEVSDNSTTQIDVSNFPAGIYYLKAASANFSVGRTFIKQ